MIRKLVGTVVLIGASFLPTAIPLQAQGVCDGVSQVNNTTVQGVVVASGLDRPLLVAAPPGDTGRIFIVEQDGVIRIKRRGDAIGTHSVFLDIDAKVNSIGNEQGLLGLAFDPDYDTNGFFYVYYTRNGSNTSVVSRFSRDAVDPDLADATSESVVTFINQPESNHNGGNIRFGNDGFLYIGTGDGGGANDNHGTCGNGQNNTNLLGKILRIDPHSTTATAPDCGAGPYTVPDDNPLNDGTGGDCDEIYSWGLRNPWRWDIDPTTGDWYLADVGQNCWEEVNYLQSQDTLGANYGWRQMEGAHCFDPLSSNNCNPSPVACMGSPACNDPSLVVPVHELSQASGACSITGGYVYRGCRMPGFDGTYFYGDYCDGIVRSFEIQGGAATNHQTWSVGNLVFDLTSFGRDAQGEIYVCDRDDGGGVTGSVIMLVPPFTEFEVSGTGAADGFLLDRTGTWTWEDLEFNSMHPVDYYSVYRGTPGGNFECIHSTLATDWPLGGDATDPGPGQLQAYLVTGTFGTEETSSGTPPRPLINPCSAP